jgi:hypothetical protein
LSSLVPTTGTGRFDVVDSKGRANGIHDDGHVDCPAEHGTGDRSDQTSCGNAHRGLTELEADANALAAQ